MIDPPATNAERTAARRGRLPQDEMQRRLRRLLKTAREEFARNGFGATSLDRLVARTGVSKTTILRHFGSKEGLFRTLIRQMMDNIEAGINAIHFDIDSPEATIAAFIRVYTRTAIADPLGHMLLGIAMLESGSHPQLAGMILQYAKQGLRPLSDYLAALTDKGQLQAADPMEAALELQGMVTQGFRVFVEDPAFLTRQDRAADIAARFLKGWASDNKANREG